MNTLRFYWHELRCRIGWHTWGHWANAWKDEAAWCSLERRKCLVCGARRYRNAVDK